MSPRRSTASSPQHQSPSGQPPHRPTPSQSIPLGAQRERPLTWRQDGQALRRQPAGPAALDAHRLAVQSWQARRRSRVYVRGHVRLVEVPPWTPRLAAASQPPSQRRRSHLLPVWRCPSRAGPHPHAARVQPRRTASPAVSALAGQLKFPRPTPRRPHGRPSGTISPHRGLPRRTSGVLLASTRGRSPGQYAPKRSTRERPS